MTAFGPAIEGTFMKLHQARRNIEVAAQMLSEREDDPTHDQSTIQLFRRLRRDLWDHRSSQVEDDEVGKLLREFEEELISYAQPVVAQRDSIRQRRVSSGIARTSG
jgi:hypothetical protein